MWITVIVVFCQCKHYFVFSRKWNCYVRTSNSLVLSHKPAAQMVSVLYCFYMSYKNCGHEPQKGYAQHKINTLCNTSKYIIYTECIWHYICIYLFHDGYRVAFFDGQSEAISRRLMCIWSMFIRARPARATTRPRRDPRLSVHVLKAKILHQSYGRTRNYLEELSVK